MQLELKLGIGGTSYEDFIRSMHLPIQLRYVLVSEGRIVFNMCFVAHLNVRSGCSWCHYFLKAKLEKLTLMLITPSTQRCIQIPDVNLITCSRCQTSCFFNSPLVLVRSALIKANTYSTLNHVIDLLQKIIVVCGMCGCSEVDPIVASFSGGAVGVITALMIVELNNVKQQEHQRCKYCHGTGLL